MASKIRLLSEEVIGKISAGEVVERPASAVKELIENSIDAGASDINIDIEDAGIKLIRISDNGSGMTQEDAEISAQRHATSKLENIIDLDTLDTLGFRGEALASIAAVSRMEILSAVDNSGEAVSLYFENGLSSGARPAARQKGTTIEIRDLFYNVPARKKFLKKESTEFAAIIDSVARFGMSYPGIGFKMSSEGRSIININKDADLVSRAIAVMGKDVAENLIQVKTVPGKYQVEGYISRPASTRKDKRQQMFFVNRRYVRSPLISSALQDSYKSLLERGRYPSCVLFIHIDPSKVDVNVHPSKLLVKFEEESRVKEALESAVKSTFEGMVRHDEASALASGLALKRSFSEEDEKSFMASQAFPEAIESQSEFDYDIPERSFDERQNVLLDENIRNGNKPERGDLFQVGNCYIVKINDDNIMITDQHAAHERIFYEFFSKKVHGAEAEVQNILFPVQIELSSAEAVCMERSLDDFKALGFEMEGFGGNTYIVRTTPPMLKDKNIKEVIHDILSDILNDSNKSVDRLETMIKYASCRAAVKAGDPLTRSEMNELLDRLLECELPFTCPHGRPTSFQITVDEMERRFRRK